MPRLLRMITRIAQMMPMINTIRDLSSGCIGLLAGAGGMVMGVGMGTVEVVCEDGD